MSRLTWIRSGCYLDLMSPSLSPPPPAPTQLVAAVERQGVAQLVARRFRKPEVVSSSLTALTNDAATATSETIRNAKTTARAIKRGDVVNAH